MNVYLTFDVEVWCGGWDRLDERFAENFERYVYGHSKHGDYALPATLDILDRHGLKGIFFVEPLFSARFGAAHLKTIVDLIQNRGHAVQLHLHPEWADEIRPPPLAGQKGKRQHLCYYSEAEQTELIALGKHLLSQAGVKNITMFRAGSYAANAATYSALSANGISVDSSLNECFAVSGADICASPDSAREWLGQQRIQIRDVASYPVKVFQDGMGRLRPAQVAACGLLEMEQAMRSAHQLGHCDFVIVSHNFELLKPNSSEPDPWMVRRFTGLCALLQRRAKQWTVTTEMAAVAPLTTSACLPRPQVSLLATLARVAQQAARRLG